MGRRNAKEDMSKRFIKSKEDKRRRKQTIIMNYYFTRKKREKDTYYLKMRSFKYKNT